MAETYATWPCCGIPMIWSHGTGCPDANRPMSWPAVAATESQLSEERLADIEHAVEGDSRQALYCAARDLLDEVRLLRSLVGRD